MKVLMIVSTLLLGTAGMNPEAAVTNPPTDIVWETSVADAKARATREGKGIFLLHMFGKLDDEMC